LSIKQLIGGYIEAHCGIKSREIQSARFLFFRLRIDLARAAQKTSLRRNGVNFRLGFGWKSTGDATFDAFKGDQDVATSLNKKTAERRYQVATIFQIAKAVTQRPGTTADSDFRLYHFSGGAESQKTLQLKAPARSRNAQCIATVNLRVPKAGEALGQTPNHVPISDQRTAWEQLFKLLEQPVRSGINLGTASHRVAWSHRCGSERDTEPTALANWAFSLKYVGPVGTVDMATTSLLADHLVGSGSMIGPRYPAVPLAPLIVAVDVADLSCLSRPVLEHGVPPALCCRTSIITPPVPWLAIENVCTRAGVDCFVYTRHGGDFCGAKVPCTRLETFE